MLCLEGGVRNCREEGVSVRKGEGGVTPTNFAPNPRRDATFVGQILLTLRLLKSTEIGR